MRLGEVISPTGSKKKGIFFNYVYPNFFNNMNGIYIGRNYQIFIKKDPALFFRSAEEIRKFISQYGNKIKWDDLSYLKYVKDYAQALETGAKYRKTDLVKLAVAQSSGGFSWKNRNKVQDPLLRFYGKTSFIIFLLIGLLMVVCIGVLAAQLIIDPTLSTPTPTPRLFK